MYVDNWKEQSMKIKCVSFFFRISVQIMIGYTKSAMLVVT